MKKQLLLVSILFFVVVLISNISVYYLTKNTIREQAFISEIAYSSMLFKSLENNDTSRVKYLLAGDIERVFIETSSIKDPKTFAPLCKHLDNKLINQLAQYQPPAQFLELFSDSRITKEQEDKGIEKFKQMCEEANK